MRPRIVIIGGGTAGTLTANRLRRVYGERAQITVVDRDDHHIYQPGLLFVPFDLVDPDRLVRSRRAQLHDGIEFQLAEWTAWRAPRPRCISRAGRRLRTTCS